MKMTVQHFSYKFNNQTDLPSTTLMSHNGGMNQLCKVCGEPAAGFHFGAFTCEGCKSFFGRTYNNVSGVSECKNGGRCEITKKNRTSCKSCRLRKCLSVGMSKSGSRYGRRSNWFKIHCLLSAQNQQNGSSPETNNNNSTITNNNTNNHHHNSHNSLGKTHLPSTITSLSSHSGHGSESDRERTPGSSASRNGSNGLPPQAFTSLAGLSPDSREHILSTLNRKLVNPDLCDYFRATSGGLGGGGVVGSGKPYYQEEDRGEDISRTTRSPGSLESPNSEASVDDVKSNTPMFTMPGSPLDVKPNDLLSFDLLTRDLMKLGYDPLRLWPAMLTTPPNLHSFNPYRFIFPNFPGAAAAFPGAFPPTPNGPPPMNGLHHGKLLSASTLTSEASCNNIPSPLSSLQNNSSATNHNHSLSPSSPPPTPIRNRVVPIVPPTSSLTLTPPISHHGADDSCFAAQKFRNLPVQDSPIDLSARATNNNHIDDYDTKKFSRVKSEFSSAMSDMDEDENQENESDRDLSDHERKREIRSDYGDSDEDDEGEDLRSTSHLRLRRSSNNNNSNCSRRSSCSRSPKRERVATPLDLTRSTNTNSSPPTKIVAT